MAHWTKQEIHFPSESEHVAMFAFNHSDLDLLTAFYQETTSPADEPILSVSDLIYLSRLFAMIADAADWTDIDDEGELLD